ncbi:hypothetical protein OG21DRAFT_1103947 [Imleria badia]|nr:hypothetical protein OG21DRAFT_1103947 [Imleria badia]
MTSWASNSSCRDRLVAAIITIAFKAFFGATWIAWYSRLAARLGWLVSRSSWSVPWALVTLGRSRTIRLVAASSGVSGGASGSVLFNSASCCVSSRTESSHGQLVAPPI